MPGVTLGIADRPNIIVWFFAGGAGSGAGGADMPKSTVREDKPG